MRSRINAWMKIARLQFYPMAFMKYFLGNIIAYKTEGAFDLFVFHTGYVVLFLIELSTILTNEYFDSQVVNYKLFA